MKRVPLAHSSRKAHGLLLPPSSPTRGIRRQPYHAVFGNDRRNADTRSAWPAQRVMTPEPLGVLSTPDRCHVHAYASATTTLKSTGATAFGNAGKAVRGGRFTASAVPSNGPPVHSYVTYSSFGHVGGSTMGTPHATPRRLKPSLGSRSGLMGAVIAPRTSLPRSVHGRHGVPWQRDNAVSCR